MHIGRIIFSPLSQLRGPSCNLEIPLTRRSSNMTTVPPTKDDNGLPPYPPFKDRETAVKKVKAAQDAWNTKYVTLYFPSLSVRSHTYPMVYICLQESGEGQISLHTRLNLEEPIHIPQRQGRDSSLPNRQMGSRERVLPAKGALRFH